MSSERAGAPHRPPPPVPRVRRCFDAPPHPTPPNHYRCRASSPTRPWRAQWWITWRNTRASTAPSRNSKPVSLGRLFRPQRQPPRRRGGGGASRTALRVLCAVLRQSLLASLRSFHPHLALPHHPTLSSLLPRLSAPPLPPFHPPPQFTERAPTRPRSDTAWMCSRNMRQRVSQLNVRKGLNDVKAAAAAAAQSSPALSDPVPLFRSLRLASNPIQSRLRARQGLP